MASIASLIRNELATRETKANTAFIELDGASLVYQTDDGPVEALRDISFRIEEGEFVTIVGPSGCGKSTLLRMIAGLRPPSHGTLSFAGQPVTGVQHSVGMVFQTPVLLPWRNIIDNVLIGAELAGLRRQAFRTRAKELLNRTGLSEFAGRRPKELSGGMQQRVSLCRALLLDPPVLLMDEPFGALDAMTRDEMNSELLRIWDQDNSARKTVLFVTHSIPEAIFLADRVAVMSSRPGRLTRVMKVALPRPRTVEQRASPEFGQLSLEIYDALKVSHPGSATIL